jgi:hypothetical protein
MANASDGALERKRQKESIDQVDAGWVRPISRDNRA